MDYTVNLVHTGNNPKKGGNNARWNNNNQGN